MNALDILLRDHLSIIEAIFEKYSILKKPSFENLKSAIILYKEPFLKDIYNMLSSESFLGISFKSDPEKKAARQTKREERKKAVAEGTEQSGWDKFQGYVYDSLNLGSGIKDLLFTRPGTKDDVVVQGSFNKSLMWIIISVSIIILLIIVLLIIKK